MGAALVALSLGVVGAAVFGLGDETIFVSPPEIVAEEFVRELGDGRAAPARRKLAARAAHVTSVDELLRVSDSVRRHYGTIDEIEGRVAERAGDRLQVRVLVKGSRAEEEVRLPIVRERGEWKVAVPFSLLPAAEARVSR